MFATPGFLLLAVLKTSTKLFVDEATTPVLDPGPSRTKTGQLWIYARDDRPWGGTDPPSITYVYAPDRKAQRSIEHLAGVRGILSRPCRPGVPIIKPDTFDKVQRSPARKARRGKARTPRGSS